MIAAAPFSRSRTRRGGSSRRPSGRARRGNDLAVLAIADCLDQRGVHAVWLRCRARLRHGARTAFGCTSRSLRIANLDRHSRVRIVLPTTDAKRSSVGTSSGRTVASSNPKFTGSMNCIPSSTAVIFALKRCEASAAPTERGEIAAQVVTSERTPLTSVRTASVRALHAVGLRTRQPSPSIARRSAPFVAQPAAAERREVRRESLEWSVHTVTPAFARLCRGGDYHNARTVPALSIL